MTEKIIVIGDVSPLELFGVNDRNLDLITSLFPKLKIIARGDTIKLIGEEEAIDLFEEKFSQLVSHYDKYGTPSQKDVEEIFSDRPLIRELSNPKGDVILYGPNGITVKARTVNQRKMVESIHKNDMVFVIGPAGSGKTYTAVALAVNALKNKNVRKIILTRPAVEAGENLGFLPGDLKEKLDPYLQPLYDALRDMLPPEKLKTYMETGVIQIAPLAFMRGRTLDNAFVILDEAQNSTQSQLKMFLTRMGKSAKFIITGDVTQVDLPKHQPSGLIQAVKLLKRIKGIDFIFLDERDIVRHNLVQKIVKAYDKE
ncbi:MAG: PhoH-like protein [Bacteroidia bacterium]|nr:PhoH-like protein [Bacteroidia bacterium]